MHHVLCVVRAFSVCLVLAAPFSAALAGEQLRVRHLVEYDSEKLILDRPIEVVSLGDSLHAVVNQGSGSVVVFDRSWNEVRRFGQLGEGPQDIDAPQGAVALGDTLWIRTPRELVGFDLWGNPIDAFRLPGSITSLGTDEGGLIGTWMGSRDGQGVAVRFGPEMTVSSVFGPACDARQPDDLGDFAECIGWEVFGRPGGGYSLVNYFRGNILVIDEAGETVLSKNLGLGEGKVLERGRYRWPIDSICQDPEGGYWVVDFLMEFTPAQLYRFDESWNLVGSRIVPEDVGSGVLRVLPDGSLCMVEVSASRLRVFERPTFDNN